MTFIAPIIFRLTFGLYSPKLEKVMMWFEHRINNYLTHRHFQQQKQLTTQTQIKSS
uniref:hypothetical protein n=1 Tax=Cyanothece sp. BG0011 TaxID=2082950 RepID=UPI0030DAB756